MSETQEIGHLPKGFELTLEGISQLLAASNYLGRPLTEEESVIVASGKGLEVIEMLPFEDASSGKLTITIGDGSDDAQYSSEDTIDIVFNPRNHERP